MVYYYYGPPYYPYDRRREPSIFDGFTLRPLPYPVLLILLVVAIFIALKSFFSFEEAFEAPEFQINWLLLAVPLVLIFAVKWLSSYQRSSYYMGPYPYGYDSRKWTYCGGPSPWQGGFSWGCCCGYPSSCVCSMPFYVPR